MYLSEKNGQSGGANRWRVCYQQGLPRLVQIELCKSTRKNILSKQTVDRPTCFPPSNFSTGSENTSVGGFIVISFIFSLKKRRQNHC